MGLAPQPEVQVFAFLPQDEGKDGVVLSAFHTRSKFAFGGRGRTTQPSPTPRTDFDYFLPFFYCKVQTLRADLE